jgi:hypothetical protein
MIKLQQLIKENKSGKLIVYHGSNDLFRKFDTNYCTQNLIWFSSDKDSIIQGNTGAAGRKYIYTLEVTINKPAGWNEYQTLGIWELKREGYDGAILKNDDNEHFDGFVFSSDQIKIVNVEKND